MGGLLYKDFAAIRGKRFAMMIGIVTVLFIALRMLLPGTKDISGFMVVNENGDVVNILDTFFFMGEWAFLVMGVSMINSWTSKIICFDEKNKTRGYLHSLPLCKEHYVASKYVFIAVSAYVFFSLYMVWHVSCAAFTSAGLNKDFTELAAVFSIPFFSLGLFSAALELPLFLILGKGRAMLIKVGVIMFFGFLIIGYVLFGNLDALGNWDFDHLVKWVNLHQSEVTLACILLPVITLLLYYGSYRIAVRLYVRKEWDDE